MAKILRDLKYIFANTDIVEFPKVKVDFTNDIEKLIVSSDMAEENLNIELKNGILSTDTINVKKILVNGVDITDKLLKFLKSDGGTEINKE